MEQNIPRLETRRHTNDGDGEIEVSDLDNQGTGIHDNPFRSSEVKKLRTPVQTVCIQNVDKDNTVFVDEVRTVEDYPT